MSNLHATEPLLYDYPQAAALLGLKTTQALRDLIFSGKGPVPTRIGRRVFFKPSDLREWVDAHRDVPREVAVIQAGAATTSRRRGRPTVRDRAQREAADRGRA